MPVKQDPVLAGRMRNLAKANETRIAKANLKRTLGEMSQIDAMVFVADRMDGNPKVLLSFTLEELLISIPSVGRTKAKRMNLAVEARLAAKWKKEPANPLPLSVRVRDLCEARRRAWSVVLQERVRHLEREASHEHLA